MIVGPSNNSIPNEDSANRMMILHSRRMTVERVDLALSTAISTWVLREFRPTNINTTDSLKSQTEQSFPVPSLIFSKNHLIKIYLKWVFMFLNESWLVLLRFYKINCFLRRRYKGGGGWALLFLNSHCQIPP